MVRDRPEGPSDAKCVLRYGRCNFYPKPFGLRDIPLWKGPLCNFYPKAPAWSPGGQAIGLQNGPHCDANIPLTIAFAISIRWPLVCIAASYERASFSTFIEIFRRPPAPAWTPSHWLNFGLHNGHHCQAGPLQYLSEVSEGPLGWQQSLQKWPLKFSSGGPLGCRQSPIGPIP